MKRVWVIGGTGLTGALLVDRLRRAGDVSLTSFVRRTVAAGDEVQLDFPALPNLPDAAPDGCDVAISCLGTTAAAAGSDTAQWRVDHDFVVDFARAARRCGARHFILMSSVGADAGSKNFYLRLKGRTEIDVAAVGFERTDVLRPGLLIGRRDERRPGEWIAQRLMGPLLPWLRGRDGWYSPIAADTVARAIVALTTGAPTTPGESARRFANRELEALAT